MSQPTVDPNDLVATGGIFAVLSGDSRVQVLSVHMNEIVVTLPFLKSAYKITVEIIEGGQEQARRAARECRTCNGPQARETQGLVCQVCGWDYLQGEP